MQGHVVALALRRDDLHERSLLLLLVNPLVVALAPEAPNRRGLPRLHRCPEQLGCGSVLLGLHEVLELLRGGLGAVNAVHRHTVCAAVIEVVDAWVALVDVRRHSGGHVRWGPRCTVLVPEPTVRVCRPLLGVVEGLLVVAVGHGERRGVGHGKRRVSEVVIH